MATCPRNSTQAAISGHAISEDATGGPRRVVRALIGAGPVLLLVTEDHQDSCRKQAISLRTTCSDSRTAPSSFSPRLACALIPCCGVEGRQHAKAKSQTELSSDRTPTPRPRPFQNGRAQQPHFAGFAPGLSVCDQSVHQL